MVSMREDRDKVRSKRNSKYKGRESSRLILPGEVRKCVGETLTQLRQDGAFLICRAVLFQVRERCFSSVSNLVLPAKQARIMRDRRDAEQVKKK